MKKNRKLTGTVHHVDLEGGYYTLRTRSGDVFKLDGGEPGRTDKLTALDIGGVPLAKLLDNDNNFSGLGSFRRLLPKYGISTYVHGIAISRFTSADAMVSQIRRGVLDLIGAARPSIADPFLPKKIEEGRFEEIGRAHV